MTDSQIKVWLIAIMIGMATLIGCCGAKPTTSIGEFSLGDKVMFETSDSVTGVIIGFSENENRAQVEFIDRDGHLQSMWINIHLLKHVESPLDEIQLDKQFTVAIWDETISSWKLHQVEQHSSGILYVDREVTSIKPGIHTVIAPPIPAPEPPKELQLGDIVRFKLGGKQMMIAQWGPDNGVTCHWVDELGQIREERLWQHELERVPDFDELGTSLAFNLQ